MLSSLWRCDFNLSIRICFRDRFICSTVRAVEDFSIAYCDNICKASFSTVLGGLLNIVSHINPESHKKFSGKSIDLLRILNSATWPGAPHDIWAALLVADVDFSFFSDISFIWHSSNASIHCLPLWCPSNHLCIWNFSASDKPLGSRSSTSMLLQKASLCPMTSFLSITRVFSLFMDAFRSHAWLILYLLDSQKSGK